MSDRIVKIAAYCVVLTGLKRGEKGPKALIAGSLRVKKNFCGKLRKTAESPASGTIALIKINKLESFVSDFDCSPADADGRTTERVYRLAPIRFNSEAS